MMRMLAIGYPLPDPAIENYNVLTAASYFDYDAVFIDPASITSVVRGLVEEGETFETFDRRLVTNYPTSASSVSAADQVRRRGEETQRLLENGGVVVVVARPNAIVPGLQGFEGCDRYSWLPAPAGLAWAPPFMRAGEGKTIRVVDEQHPFAHILREFRQHLGYRAVFDDRQQAVRLGRVLGTGGANVPIAMQFDVMGGRVVFLPAMSHEPGSFRADLATAIVAACRQLIGTRAAITAPYWERSLALPGLEQLEAELDEADQAAAAANTRAAGVHERHDELAGHRRLLWEEGAGYRAAVADALRALGFDLSDEDDGTVVESEGQRAMIETESSLGEVVEWPYVRLQRRLETRLLQKSDQLKGIVIVNGRREWAPEVRESQYSDPLRIACENYRYALVTGETLFALVQRALGGASDSDLSGIRRRLMNAAGLVETQIALGEVEEESDAGPIF